MSSHDVNCCNSNWSLCSQMYGPGSKEVSEVYSSSLLEGDIREAIFILILLPSVSRYLCWVFQVAAETEARVRAGRDYGRLYCARIFDKNIPHLGRLSFPKWLAPSSDNERAQQKKSKSVKFLNILLSFLLSLVMEPFLCPNLTLYKIHYTVWSKVLGKNAEAPAEIRALLLHRQP